MNSKKFTVVILFFYLRFTDSRTIENNLPPPKCQSCHPLVKGKINVHLVPHSHDDVGWLKTFSQYYYGTGKFSQYQDAGVQYILSSTVQALKANSDRRFIQVETAFFWKWWQEQNDTTKNDVIDLVNSGQLEMVNGAWSMNDEATTNYQSIIDQFTWGFRILENTVSPCARPKIGWQIDPFGHSREHASLLKQFGFEGLVIGRLDYRDKERRKIEKSLDFVWTSSSNLNDSQIFTTMFPDFYVDEPGYHFDIMYGDSIDDNNLQRKVDGFSSILGNYREYYKTSNIMMPMGNDFTYQVAERNFENIDKLVKGFKNHAQYNVIYSTPSCYIQAVKAQLEEESIVLEEKTDDFFPYASNSHNFWTGYYTSRPTLKRFEKEGNNILQSVKQLATFSRTKGKEKDIYTLDLRQAMGVLQHHDAITGTEKQAVADDYAKMLYDSIRKAEEPVGEIITDLLKQDTEETVSLNFTTCLLTNVSICAESQKNRFVVAVQNPLSRTVSTYVHLPVDGGSYKITGPDGVEIYDIIDTIHSFDFITSSEKVSSKELVFSAKSVPPLGIKLYYVENTSTSQDKSPGEVASKKLIFSAKSVAPLGIKHYYVENTSTSQNKSPREVASKKLIFSAKSVPPLGIKHYYVENTSTSQNKSPGEASSKELIFSAKSVLPLDLKLHSNLLYHVENTSTSQDYKPYEKNPLAIPPKDIVFGTNYTGFAVDGGTGELKTVTIMGVTQEITQQFLYYTTSSSGAYIFRPRAEAKPIIKDPLSDIKIIRKNLVDEYIRAINQEITQIIRVHKSDDRPYIEFEWLVGNLQYEDSYGKEIITRYIIKNFNNDNTFYTDSNGREQIERKVNHRNDYTYNATEEPVSSNYYPITSRIAIRDQSQNLELAILTDRSQGGTSLENGVIELMLHRKLRQDDGLGVDEVLNETQYDKGLYVRGQHYLTFGEVTTEATAKSIMALERKITQEISLAPWILVADATDENLTLEKVQKSLRFEFSGLKNSLPENVQILTLEPWIDSYILRLEHILEKSEDNLLSQPATVDLNNLFTLFNITEIQETTLGANEALENSEIGTDLKVTLYSMQIKTFIFKTDKNNVGGHDNSDGDDNGGGNNNNNNGSKTFRAMSVLSLLCILIAIM